MKTIVIFCRNVDPKAVPFSDEYYWNSYQDLLLALKARGVNAYFATDNKTYAGNGIFTKAYTTDTKCAVEDFTLAQNVKADLVYEKGGFTGTDVRILNPEFIRSVATKIGTYEHFKEYQPRSIVCHSKEDLLKAFSQLDGDKVVVKEPEGHGGNEVYIGSREAVLTKIPADTYPLLAQEFVDTSVGVEGLAEGAHDVRVEIVGGDIIGGTLRIPAPGEFRANIAQGGTERFLFVDEIPAGAAQLALQIDKRLQRYPRHYAADFARTPDGWKLIELNSKPGLSPVNSSPQARQIMESVADYLVKVCP